MKAALAKIGHGAKPSAEDAPVFLLPVLVPLWNAWRDLHANDREYSPMGGIGTLPRDAIRERLRDVDRSVRALWRRLLAVLEAEYRVASSEMADHERAVKDAEAKVAAAAAAAKGKR